MRAAHGLAHLLEETLPLAGEDEAGADDHIALRIEEALERVLAAGVVAGRVGMRDDARDEDEAPHPGAARRLQHAARAFLVHAPDLLEVREPGGVGTVDDRVGAVEHGLVEHLGQVAAPGVDAGPEEPEGVGIADQRAHLPAAAREVAAQVAAERAGGAGHRDDHASSSASRVPTRSAFAIRLKVSPFGGIQGKIEPSAR